MRYYYNKCGVDFSAIYNVINIIAKYKSNVLEA